MKVAARVFVAVFVSFVLLFVWSQTEYRPTLLLLVSCSLHGSKRQNLNFKLWALEVAKANYEWFPKRHLSTQVSLLPLWSPAEGLRQYGFSQHPFNLCCWSLSVKIWCSHSLLLQCPSGSHPSLHNSPQLHGQPSPKVELTHLLVPLSQIILHFLCMWLCPIWYHQLGEQSLCSIWLINLRLCLWLTLYLCL